MEMCRRGLARKSFSRRSITSEQRYELEEKDAFTVADEILNNGAIVCVPPKSKITAPTTVEVFEDLVKLSSREIVLVAPYISGKFVDCLGPLFKDKSRITTIIASSKDSRYATSSSQVLSCIENGYRVNVTQQDLHAKIYFFDKRAALIGSSNLTQYGFLENFELNVLLFGESCKVVQEFVSELGARPYKRD